MAGDLVQSRLAHAGQCHGHSTRHIIARMIAGPSQLLHGTFVVAAMGDWNLRVGRWRC